MLANVGAQGVMQFLPFMRGPFVTSSGSTEVTNGLVAWWKMENNSNDSWDSNNGTDTSMSYVTSPVKLGTYSASFDGTASKITVTSTNVSEMTFSAWVWPRNGVNDANGSIVGKYGDSANYSYYFRWNGTYLRPQIVVRIGGAANPVDSPTTLTASNWWHILARADGTKISLYTNGVFCATGAGVGTVQSSTANITIGSLNGSAQYIQGFMDDLRLYNRAITPAEIYTISASTSLAPTNTTTKTNLVADGDSLTAGSSVAGWPTFIGTNRPSINIINLAVSGDSYVNMLGRIPAQAQSYSPSAVSNILVLWNSNDTKLGASTNTVWARITEAIQNGVARGYSVAVGTLIPRGDYTTAMNTDRTNINILIRNQAVSTWGATWVVDFTTNSLLDYNVHPENFQGDTIHPTQTGEYIVATNVLNVIWP